MPAVAFSCKRGLIPFADCLRSCPDRCALPRTLRLMAEQRPWEGIPSTTQLLQGTRESFLKITCDYAINPDGRAFAVHGSRVHEKLDLRTGDDELGEERLYDLICSGQFDNYSMEDGGTLADSKTSGSYKVMKALGLRQVERPLLDASGNTIYLVSGKNKGKPKTEKVTVSGGYRDMLDWAIQLNDYRMKIEAVGFPVGRMVIEALVRDGGTYIAKSRGIDQNIYLIPINHISNRWIERYFAAKWGALRTALETGKMPKRCRTRETWNRRKCDGYCDVADKCFALDRGASLEDVKGVSINEVPSKQAV
jgi:hypothetical protein